MLVPDMRSSEAGGDHRRAGASRGDRAAGLTSHPPQTLVQALDAFVDVLSNITDETPGVDHGFYDGLCEAIVRQTSIERAAIFRYDGAQRRVRAAGSAGVDLSVFDGLFANIEILGEARRALEEDTVVETRDYAGVPPEFEYIVKDRVLVVAPMVAAGRWIGVVVGDRRDDAPPLGEAERHLLWTLGKTAALAAMARIATSQAHRARELEERIDMARDIHDGVIQRLFGVSLALAGDGDLDADSRRRAADELQAALQELREAVQRPLRRLPRPTGTTLAAELERLTGEHPELGLVLEAGDPDDVPDELQALAQSVLVEAIRNAQKHASPRRVAVRVSREDGAFVLVVTNDGVASSGRTSGMGLRLAALETLQHGGVIEFGRTGPDAWQVRLVVPHER
jgi:signal transduction histidine kinase